MSGGFAYDLGYVLVVCLVVLIPLITRMHAVEVSRLSWPILVFPIVCRRVNDVLFEIEELLFFIHIFFGFGSIERF